MVFYCLSIYMSLFTSYDLILICVWPHMEHNLPHNQAQTKNHMLIVDHVSTDSNTIIYSTCTDLDDIWWLFSDWMFWQLQEHIRICCTLLYTVVHFGTNELMCMGDTRPHTCIQDIGSIRSTSVKGIQSRTL